MAFLVNVLLVTFVLVLHNIQNSDASCGCCCHCCKCCSCCTPCCNPPLLIKLPRTCPCCCKCCCPCCCCGGGGRKRRSTFLKAKRDTQLWKRASVPFPQFHLPGFVSASYGKCKCAVTDGCLPHLVKRGKRENLMILKSFLPKLMKNNTSNQ